MKQNIYHLPPDFLGRLKKITGPYYNQICNTFLAKKEPSFRINYLKTDLRSLREQLLKAKIKYKQLSWPKGAFILKSQLRHLQNSFIYKEGFIYVQNISSMIPVIVLSPQKGDKILDLCAAPGTKTTQIASMLGPPEGDTEVIAIEKIRIRYYKLLANLKIQGADVVEPLIYDGVWVRKKFPEYFDKLLLDTPCSAEGRFYINNPRSFKYWKYRKVKEMAHKQKRLFSSAVRALKPHGILVYSTCTFSPEENEAIADWAINKHKDLELLPIEIPLNNSVRGLKSWAGKKFSDSLKLTRRIIPDKVMEGFFIAKFRKK